MKMIAVFALALVAVAAAAPADVQNVPNYPQIVKSEYNQDPQGSYDYKFKSDDGTSRVEVGELKETVDEEGKPLKVIIVRGEYTYTDSEGKPQTVQYYADEDGFHATGDIILKEAPVAPVRR